MFAKYQYTSSATQAQVQADLLLILTGTTNLASLSASCNQANSSISTTYDVAGWTSYDTAAYTNGFCVRALQQDGVTYKYMLFNASSNTVWTTAIAEDWDNGAHTGTNVVTTSNLAWAASSGGIFWIYASGSTIIIRHTNVALSVLSALACSYEMDNSDGMVIAGYPTTFLGVESANSANLAVATPCRIKHPSTVGDLTTTSAFAVSMLGTSGSTGMAPTYAGMLYRDAAEALSVCFMPPCYVFSSSSTGSTYGIPGKVLGNIRLSPSTYTTATFLDTIVIGATTYICLLDGSQFTLWVAQG